MPPQVREAGPRPAVPQAPLPQDHKDESKDIAKSTSSESTGAAKTQTAETKSDTSTQHKKEPEDPKAAARQAQGSKQIAIAKNHQQNERAQMIQKNLQRQVTVAKTGTAYTAAELAADAAKAGMSEIRHSHPVKPSADASELKKGESSQAQRTALSHAAKQQGVENLRRNQYPQDIVKGQYFELEKITPGKTDTFKNVERVEDRSRGDVASRRYHQEQHRTSTQSGLEDRLKDLNQGKELTDFEKGLVSEWDPQMKGSGKNEPIKGISPISDGPSGVQAYKVQRGNYSTYHDRNGNVLVDEGTKQNRVLKLDQRKHPQEMVKGEYFEVERIFPGTTDKVKTNENVDLVRQRIHKQQSRTSTQSGLENRLKELNQGKELTPFEKGLVSEWDPKMKGSNGRDAITDLSPIKDLNSSGEKGSTEVQAYKISRGSGNREVSYYDRNGNRLLTHKSGGEAIPTDGPVDYLSLAKVGTEAVLKKGVQIGEQIFAKEVTTVTKAETGAVVRSAEEQIAKAETGTAARTAEQRAATQPQQVKPQEQWQDVNVANKKGKNDMNRPSKQQEMDNASHESSGVKNSHVNEKKPAESKKAGEEKGANVSKSNRMSRPADEIKKELDESREELRRLKETAGQHVQERTGWQEAGKLPQDLPISGIAAKLRQLADNGDETAARMLREIEDIQRRLQNLGRETTWGKDLK
jgi:hypothetical protein